MIVVAVPLLSFIPTAPLNLYHDLDSVPSQLLGGAVTIGNFDGVHHGHAKILQRVVEIAKQRSANALAFTFNPHPAKILRPSAAPTPLTWLERRANLIEQTGINGVVAYPADEKLLALSAEDFFRQIIVEQLQAKAVVEGPNFFFGRDRAGDVNTLKKLCGQYGIQCEIISPASAEKEIVSSSRIRKLVQQGRVAEANTLLTAPYRIRGVVSQGAQRGQTLGFPTANLDQIDTLIPSLGVYGGRAILSEAETFPAAIHIGPNPTFGDDALKIEIHLIGFSGDLYGALLQVEIFEKIREVVAFESVDELVGQLTSDVERAGEIGGSRN